MERLAHLIQASILDGEWQPIKLTRTGPPISHLFFADDIILFAEASMDQVEIIKRCLEKFCASSGLKVNLQKTRVFFSKNVNHVRKTEMCTSLGFSITSDLGKYLGVPLHHNRVTKESFHYVVDKVTLRLSKWKAKSLSLAGRSTLVSSVTSAIPGYVMQTSSLPASTCGTLDACNRKFLWGSSTEQRKVPLVAWEMVCKPKSKGGLGIRHTAQSNKAYLMKVGWQLASKRDDFWVKVIRNKYNCGSDIIPQIDLRRQGSNLWGGIKRSWGKVLEGIELLPNNILRWKGSKSGIFTVKSAYEGLNSVGENSDDLWNKVWKLRIPERCKTFIWLVLHKKLLTNMSRCSRGLSTDPRCHICFEGNETLLHVLRDCRDSLELWKQIVPQSLWRSFCRMDIDSWLRWNICRRGRSKQLDEWKNTFVLVCWWLWRRRNSWVFEEKKVSNSSVLNNILALRSSLSAAYQRLGKTKDIQITHQNSEERWNRPRPGQVKINVDGAFSRAVRGIASGGVMRNDQGQFLRGFMFKGDGEDSLDAELWGCVHGLKIAWDMGFRDIVLESDSSDAVNLINNPVNEAHEDCQLIHEIKSMVGRGWTVEINHVSRWANAAADHLARSSLSAFPGLFIVSSADDFLQRKLDNDNG